MLEAPPLVRVSHIGDNISMGTSSITRLLTAGVHYGSCIDSLELVGHGGRGIFLEFLGFRDIYSVHLAISGSPWYVMNYFTYENPTYCGLGHPLRLAVRPIFQGRNELCLLRDINF